MGFRIEPGDIENNLLRIPGVTQAAVSVSANKRLTAQVAVDNLTAEEIRHQLSAMVPGYMVPGKITVTQSLPVNGNFKLRRE